MKVALGDLSLRPPGIYRLMLAPARRDKASRQAVAGPPDPNLAVRKPPDRRSGRIPALPYPPLEHLQISRASSPIKWPRPKSTFARTSPFANYKLSPFADTAVSFCSHRDRPYLIGSTDLFCQHGCLHPAVQGMQKVESRMQKFGSKPP